ncbi:MAG: sugar transferase [Solirubrobacterales bacterium]|nr:sugar transferase [Solirubrobacterales bacterium]
MRAQRTLTWVGVELAPGLAATLVALSHTTLGLSLALGAVMILLATGFERRRYPLHLLRVAGHLARFSVPLGATAAILLASLAFDPVPVGEVVTSLLAAWLVLAVVLYVIHSIGRGLELRLAVLGSAGVASALRSELELARLSSHHVVGWIDFQGHPDAGEEAFGDALGGLADVREVVIAERIDVVVFALRESGAEALGVSSIEALEEISHLLLGTDVRMIGANNLYEELFGHVPLATMNAAWFQYVLHPRFRAGGSKQKRLLDLFVGLPMTLLALPVLAVAALAIKLGDRGPALYRQRRVGEEGKEFEMLKLRTMRTDAEHDGVAQWSSADDERITAVGRWLRRTHIDELPQLINVLRGEMSLVGPRPERRALIAALEQQLPYYDRRHLMKPGITGWAQVRIGYAGTNRGTAWKLCHDLFYFKHRSVGLDLMILADTLVTPVHDIQVESRLPDETFVVEAVRERV